MKFGRAVEIFSCFGLVSFVGYGQAMVKLWSSCGQVMVKLWSSYGQVMVKLWSSYGQPLVKFWSRFGSSFSLPSVICEIHIRRSQDSPDTQA